MPKTYKTYNDKRLHTCGKRRFPDRIAALLDMERIHRKKDSKREHLPVRVYECPRCGGFHLTHLPEAPREGA